jgi:nicotinate-nucleotide adenylyltransferase
LSGIAPPAPVVPGRLGILGGTFDPIHHGHLAIAEEAREALGLERVLFVPAARPPHKPGRPIAGAEDRLAMVRLAIAGNPAFEASRIELDRDGPSYTAETLQRLCDQGARDLWFILSGEALAGLPGWHQPDRVLELARLAVVPRGGSPAPDRGWIDEQFPGRRERFVFLSGPLMPISGSVIRQRLAAGRSVRYLVPEAAAAYLDAHRLYAQPDGGS